MAIALVVLACLQGVVIGVFAADLLARRADVKAREALAAELVSTQKALAELHNKNAAAMQALQDKVNAHSMALASGVKFK